MNKYVENAMQLITKSVILALGIPYFLAIAVNVFFGWPSSRGEEKYKALHPHKVYKLNYALVEQVALLKWFPLFLKWNQFYRNSDDATKDLTYGRNGNTLDIWRPDSDSQSDDDMNKAPNSRPVIVFIYGGAWGSGHKGMYGLLGKSLANMFGCVVVIPNYSTYPKGTAPDMLHDIEDTVHFIQSSTLIKSYGADSNQVILVGHSAGAHLAAQVAIQLANISEPIRHQEPSCVDKECESSNKFSDHEIGSNPEKLYEKSDAYLEESDKFYVGDTSTHQVSNNAESSSHDAIHAIKGVVGIGGVYHIMDQYHHETWRGVEDFSAMWRVMHEFDNFNHFSPALAVQKLTADETKRLPSFLLIHGAKDKTVPVLSSEKFAEALSTRDVPVTLKVLVDGGHAELALDMMESGRTWYDPMIGLIREWMTANKLSTSVH